LGKKDKKIDAYVQKSADFAKPILEHLRTMVHKACPQTEEAIKWGFPHFLYEGILCSMAAFKQHCVFAFWKGSIMKDPYNVMSVMGKTAMGNFGRITRRSDLPSDKILIEYIKEAAKLNENDISIPRKVVAKRKELIIPDYFQKALQKNKKSLATFEEFSFTNKKEYLEWITEAKSPETQARRLATAIEWMAEGKIRNWKYVKK
jgi:uncharacterized protein YdeI (YjbR/CyaY-like superfamily)